MAAAGSSSPNAILRQPIAMRVIVNRVWKGHFGTGLVDTPSNFGVAGERPTNPELLEHLAQRFVDQKLSIKQLHRDIMLSAVYQLSTRILGAEFREGRREPAVLARRSASHDGRADPRFAAVRLRLAGSTRWAGHRPRCRRRSTRRTVYGKVSRYKLDDYLQLFDFPSPNLSAERRFTTTVPLQRLFFMNSDFMQQQGELIARRVARGAEQHGENSEGVPPHLRPGSPVTRKSKPASRSWRPSR